MLQQTQVDNGQTGFIKAVCWTESVLQNWGGLVCTQRHTLLDHNHTPTQAGDYYLTVTEGRQDFTALQNLPELSRKF